MKEKELTVKAALHILIPVNEVFEAIVDSAMMSNCIKRQQPHGGS